MHDKKKRTDWYPVTLTGFACAVALFPVAVFATPIVPDTNDTTWRYQSPPQPGWTSTTGTCDTSSVDVYGLEASAGAFADPALAGYIDEPGAIPIEGHSHFASCGTWRDGEGAAATISGLTVGEIYIIDFFVAGFRPLAESIERENEVGNSYRIAVGDQTSGLVSFDSVDWIAQSFTFTAANTEETLAIDIPASDRRSVTHFAIAADAITVVETEQDGLLASDATTVVDTDQDGVSDAQEVAAGSDINNPDTDGDGLTDGEEILTYDTDPTTADTDGGGVDDGTEITNGTDPLANSRDDIAPIDTDGDGLTDDIEASLGTSLVDVDTDGDGLTDTNEVNTLGTDPTLADTDNDGLSDARELTVYLTDPLEPDTDGDGLLDGPEITTHNTNPANDDTDDDALSDGAEVTTHNTDPLITDTDGDDLSDGNEINTLNTNPNNPDTDGDGLTDAQELTVYSTDPLIADTDGSGVEDGEEVASGADPLDGSDDVTNLDIDNDGIPNTVEGTGDRDSDGIPNVEDLDSDNDGIADIIEAGGSDTDNDGRVDNFSDTNNDGLDDALAAIPLVATDTDLDGIADFLDTDSDNDGLADLFEAGGIDGDNNGVVDDLTDANNDGRADTITTNPLPLTDTDQDSIANFLELDSDNDGIFDLPEAGGVDTDNNGIVDLFLDSDADGIPDLADIDSTGGQDTNGDGIDDTVDASITLADDFNQNGIDDNIEADVDGDGWAAAVLNDVTLPDTNSNGTPEVFESIGDLPMLVTGVSGGFGCSLMAGDPAKPDPLLLLLATTSLVGLVRRRKSVSGS